MIVDMKRATVIVVDKEKEKGIKELRKTGVVHLKKMPGTGEKLASLLNKNQKLSDAIAILDSRESEIPEQKNGAEPIALADEILDTSKKIQNWENELVELEQRKEKLIPWGDFDPSDIRMLSEKGINISLCLLDEQQIESLKSDYSVFELSRKGKNIHAVIISRDKPLELNEELFELPELGIQALEEKKRSLKKDIEEAEAFLDSYLKYDLFLKKEETRISKDCEFENVNSGMLSDSGVSWLSGYVPVSRTEDLKAKAAEERWGIILQDPEEEEEVPTLLKQNPVAKLLNPILDLLGIVPGYRELDVSLYFLIFFSIFTAMLIGDAGYGTIYLAICLFFTVSQIRKGKKIGTFLTLGIVLSLCIIFWGSITGTWFASLSLIDLDFFKSLKLAYFTGDEEAVNHALMYVSFTLGVTQLSLACIQGFLKDLPEIKAFARIGWLLIIVPVYFFVLSQVLSMTFPPSMLWILIVGVALVILFGNQAKGKSFVKGLIDSLINLFPLVLDIIGSFSNVMSYIRLFAVGLAGVKVAQTFNAMAAPLMDSGAAIIGGIIILLLGHTLNIILGLLAVFVHAVRLNVLEYSGQLGIEWSGFKYEPFKE